MLKPLAEAADWDWEKVLAEEEEAVEGGRNQEGAEL